MIALSLAAVADITGGRLAGIDPDAAARLIVDGPVVTDSREAGPGSLYVARIGESQDGHRFIAPAAERGAVAALVTQDLGPLPRVVVADEQEAFICLARRVADSVPGLRIVGITGSSGKTSTKDLLGQVLSAAGETIAPIGSYNSEVGVPLTVCRVTESTRFLVVELGARAVGHIAYLTKIAPPRIGIVLNVGSAHVGEFGSRERIALAKSELVRALPPDGLAILNADDPLVREMAGGTAARVLLVGESPDADLRADRIELGQGGRPSFRVTGAFGAAELTLAVAGRHHVGNALAVLAAALEFGMPIDTIAAALAAAGPISRYRMEVADRTDGVTIVNDAYNANPESMAAALDALASMGAGRRRVAVLGPMLELGADSAAAHAAVGELAIRRGVSELIVVGETARPIAEAAEAAVAEAGAAAPAGPAPTVRFVPDAEAAYAVAAVVVRPGDIVLVKSSNGAGLRFLGDRLRDTQPSDKEEETR